MSALAIVVVKEETNDSVMREKRKGRNEAAERYEAGKEHAEDSQAA